MKVVYFANLNIYNMVNLRLSPKSKYSFVLVFLFLGCANDDNKVELNNQRIQYSFEIKFGGETHKIAGGFSDYFDFSQSTIQNHSLANLSQGTLGLGFQLNDISATDYISGQPLYFNLRIENPQIGNNNIGELQINSRPYTDDYATANGIRTTAFWSSEYVENTSMEYTDAYRDNLIGKLTKISLSNLGTSPSSIGTYDGENVQGSYEGVLYYRQRGQTTEQLFNVPVPIKITFSAVRGN